MAVDEALLERVQPGEVWLRFYGWRRATLSLGYFQSYPDELAGVTLSTLDCVRRVSGGGAIIHDNELTYALVVGSDASLAEQPQNLYRATHASLIAALASWNLHPRLSVRPAENTPEPFLCFRRRGEGDVLLDTSPGVARQGNNVKIAGSAQRRRRGHILQHGSVLLRHCPAAPEIWGIADAGGMAISPAQLVQAWLPWLARELHVEMQPAKLPDRLLDRAAEIESEKYRTRAWLRRR